jgi:hypothetical protein
MVVSMVVLLFGLFFSALILLVCACILGSIYAALRAVGRESDCRRENLKQGFGVASEVTLSEDDHLNFPCATQTFRANALR